MATSSGHSASGKDQWKYPQSSRLARDGRAFTVEEKFDTWLDLEFLHQLQRHCRMIEHDNVITKDDCGMILSADSICELHMLEIIPYKLSTMVVTPTLPAIILAKTLKGSCNQGAREIRQSLASLDTVRHACISTLECQLNHLGSNMSATLKDILRTVNQPWEDKITSWPVEISYAYCNMIWWSEAVGKFRKLHEYMSDKVPMARARKRYERGYLIHKGSQPTEFLELCHDIAIYTKGSTQYLLDTNLLKEVYNKSCELFVLLLYSHLQAGVNLPNNHYHVSLKWVSHLVNKVVSLGKSRHHTREIEKSNRGFAYLKMIEGLGVAELIRRSDTAKGWENDDLCRTLWETILAERLDGAESWEYSDLWHLFHEMTSAQIADLIGTIKIAGHPTIDIEAGLDKLYERTHAHIRVDNRSVSESIAVLTRELFLNFYRRHKKYPEFDLHVRPCCQALHQLLDHNTDPSSVAGSQLWQTIPRNSWSHLSINKTQEFDPIDNQLPLLKDKAMGVIRSKVIQSVLTRSCQSAGVIGSPVERRALLAYLISPHFSHDFQVYMDNYQSDGEWTSCVLNYLVIKLTPKELELKSEGRMFGASPLEERNRRIVQEMNCMRLMDHYVPDQLMTPNELLMIKKLYSFRCLGRVHPDSYVLQVSFDFSKWNNNMRAASIDVPAARLLDAWFGTNLYGKTMSMYENALIYYSDNHRTRYWEGQLGGIEGLNQATWSYIFLGGIKNALERLGVLHQITVKGDDVRAALIIPRHDINPNIPLKQALERKRDDILGALEQLCQAMGWELKPEESFVSLSLVATSKQYQLNDTWLPASSKKIMKCMSLSDLMFPTIEDIVANAFSIAHSACSQTTVVLPSYICATLCGLLVLQQEYLRYHLKTHELTTLILWPQILGGPGGLPLQTFFVRGENDMLSVTLSLIRHIANNNYPELSDMMWKLLSIQITNPEDKSLLVSDPYAIPIIAPTRPSTVLRNILKAALKKWVKNPDLLALLTASAERDKESLLSTLLSCTPYYGKLVTMIWECSPFYLIEEILSKFMQSSTVVAFLSKGRTGTFSTRLAHRTLQKVVDAAILRMRFWLRTVKTPLIPNDDMMGVPETVWRNDHICTTEIVHQIREKTWGMRMYGVTYPSLIDQNYLAQLSDIDHSMNASLVKDGLTRIHINREAIRFQTDDVSHHYASNEMNIPWLGSQTSTKIKFLDGPIEVKSSTLSKISKLITLLRLGDYYGQSFRDLVSMVLKGLTSVPHRNLTLLSPEVPFGHIGHRGTMNSFSLTTMPNYRPNLSQIVDINNESLMLLRKDTYNRTINYAARNFFLVVVALFPLQFQLNLPLSWPEHMIAFFHHDVRKNGDEYSLCPFCCNIIDDFPVRFSSYDVPDLSQYRELPIVGTSEFEEKQLKAQIETSIKGKAKRYLHEQGYDTNNLLNQQKAIDVVLRSLTRESIGIFHEAHRAGFSHIPKGALLDTMAVSMGFKSLVSSSLSLNVIRAMEPTLLYENLVTECFAFIESLFLDGDFQVEFGTLGLLQSHLNPLAGLFQQLNNAGVLHKLTYGAEQSGVTNKKLHWPPGTSKDGHASSKHFITHHMGIYRRWLEGSARPPDHLRFNKMPDDDSIMDVLDQHYIRLGKIMISQICRWLTTTSVVTTLRKWVRRQLELLYDEYQGPRPIDRDELTYYMEGQMDGMIMRDGVSPTNTWLSYTALIGLLFEFVFLVTRGLWYDGDITELLETNRDIVLMDRSYEDPPDPTEVNWNLLRNNIWLSWTFRYVTDPELELLWIVYNYIITSPTYAESSLLVMRECFEDIWTKCKWHNTARVTVMTEEDAERILRNCGHTLESYLDNVEMVMADEVDRNDIRTSIAQLCPLHDRVNAGNVIGETLWITSPDQVQQIYDNLAHNHLLGYTDIVHHRVYITDVTQVARCMGGHNSAICKWMYLYHLLHVERLLPRTYDRITMVAIGDGNGGMTRLICKLHPNVHSLICTLAFNPLTGEPAQDYDISTPPLDLTCNVDDPTLIRRVNHTTCYPGDISDVAIRNIILQHLIKTESEMDICWCDIDWVRAQPYERYLHNIWCVINMFQEFRTQDTFAIVKVKVVRTVSLTNLLSYIYHRFPHSHFIVNPYSTCRDSEIFIFIGSLNFPNDGDPRGGQAEARIGAYIPSGSFINELHRIQQELENKVINQFSLLDNNIVSMRRFLSPLIEGPFCVQTIDRLMMLLEAPVYIQDYHLCTLIAEISRALNEKLNGLQRTHFRLYPSAIRVHGAPPVRNIQDIRGGASSNIIAKGPSGLSALVRGMLTLQLRVTCLQDLAEYGFQVSHNLSSMIGDIKIAIGEILERHSTYMRLVYSGYQVILLIGPIRLNLNAIIADCYQECVRMFGAILILSARYLHLYGQGRRDITLGEHSFPNSLCCHQAAQRLSPFLTAVLPHPCERAVLISEEFTLVDCRLQDGLPPYDPNKMYNIDAYAVIRDTFPFHNDLREDFVLLPNITTRGYGGWQDISQVCVGLAQAVNRDVNLEEADTLEDWE